MRLLQTITPRGPVLITLNQNFQALGSRECEVSRECKLLSPCVTSLRNAHPVDGRLNLQLISACGTCTVFRVRTGHVKRLDGGMEQYVSQLERQLDKQQQDM